MAYFANASRNTNNFLKNINIEMNSRKSLVIADLLKKFQDGNVGGTILNNFQI